MTNRLSRLVILCSLLMAFAAPASADVWTFHLMDHPNGNQAPPTYGLRLDDLIQNDEYTFSFDYSDGSGMADMTLEYDNATGEIHIYGRAYGGRDTGAGWDPAESGWIDVDFTYRENVIRADNINGDPGDDIYVLVADPNNNGTITLDGWGGNVTINYSDKAASGYSFIFDSDEDSKGNATIANDPTLWSAAGWLMGHGSPSRDWLFLGELEMTVGTTDESFGSVKAQF